MIDFTECECFHLLPKVVVGSAVNFLIKSSHQFYWVEKDYERGRSRQKKLGPGMPWFREPTVVGGMVESHKTV